MANEQQNTDPGPRTEATEPAENGDTLVTEGGRIVPIDGSPEARMLHEGEIATGEAVPLPPDMRREASFAAIDDFAAEEARLEVRRQEHSAD